MYMEARFEPTPDASHFHVNAVPHCFSNLFMSDIVKVRNAWNAYCGIPLKNTYDYQQASSKIQKRLALVVDLVINCLWTPSHIIVAGVFIPFMRRVKLSRVLVGTKQMGLCRLCNITNGGGVKGLHSWVDGGKE